MNFLAHTFLSFEQEELLAGNFMADFCTTKDLVHLPSGLLQGVALHREIDRFTDQHPLVRESIAVIRPKQRKYSPVVIDIVYDHYLTREWQDHHEKPLQEFASSVYHDLSRKKEHFPVKLQAIFSKMVEDNFLLSCENEERLRRTFERIARRANFDHQFLNAYDDIMEHDETLYDLFQSFFPELKENIRQLFFNSNPDS